MTVATVVPAGFSLIENDITHVRRIWPTSALGYITGWTVVTPTDPQPATDLYPGGVDDTELDGDVKNLINSASQTQAALRAGYVPRWQATTAYASGDIVLNPSGSLVQANSSFTSGSSYNAANWTVLSASTTDAAGYALVMSMIGL